MMRTPLEHLANVPTIRAGALFAMLVAIGCAAPSPAPTAAPTSGAVGDPTSTSAFPTSPVTSASAEARAASPIPRGAARIVIRTDFATPYCVVRWQLGTIVTTAPAASASALTAPSLPDAQRPACAAPSTLGVIVKPGNVAFSIATSDGRHASKSVFLAAGDDVEITFHVEDLRAGAPALPEAPPSAP